MAKRFNIRMAGVGGQGVVTGSHILSTAVINAGGESTIVPFYGSEKRMAPVESSQNLHAAARRIVAAWRASTW